MNESGMNKISFEGIGRTGGSMDIQISKNFFAIGIKDNGSGSSYAGSISLDPKSIPDLIAFLQNAK